VGNLPASVSKMKHCLILLCLALNLQAVKFVKDVLPAAGAVTTIVVNGDTLVKAIKHPKVTVKKVVKKMVKK
jgi:hypothetical protein